MTDTMAQWLWGIGALVLVGSSLVARRLPVAQTLKMILLWVAIFGFAFVLFLFRDEGRAIWQRAKADVGGNAAQVSGSTIRIRKSDDGHFWVRASVNGKPVNFLIDSGATTTTLSRTSASAANVEPSGGFPVMVETANGTVEAQRARIAMLVVGSIRQQNAPAHIGDKGLGETNLLGMSFLSSLKSWRVEGSTLILEPPNI
jgi:aspartyl protease family protein